MIALGGAVCGLVGWTALRPADPFTISATVAPIEDLSRGLDLTVARLDDQLEKRWAEHDIVPARTTDELTVLRRLYLALIGMIPSLEEVREFEADDRPDRLRRWTLKLLNGRRFADYFAERLAIAFVGTIERDLPWYDQGRFEYWLADQLEAGRPYHEMVHQMISEAGPPTSRAAANFVTAEVVQGEQFANRLAARSARAFLGQRIDCAECHDHPFDRWTQEDFHGLAAYFAEARTAATQLRDDPDRRHEVEDRDTLERRVVEPRVPFRSDWIRANSTLRREIADWITHPENDRFYRAIANRVWGLLFGRPYIAPVDAVPDSPEETHATGGETGGSTSTGLDLLDTLALDLREHGGDLRRLILVIASSRAFQLASEHESLAADGDVPLASLTTTWAVFPLVQLRPEQFARSLLQAASVQSLDWNGSAFARIQRELWLHRFIEQYGSLGENELDERVESIPQTIHRMHSRFTRETSRAEWNKAAGRIGLIAPDNTTCVEICYLVCLTRRPTAFELEHFVRQFADTRTMRRHQVVEDIFWTLLNSPEFGWNH